MKELELQLWEEKIVKEVIRRLKGVDPIGLNLPRQDYPLRKKLGILVDQAPEEEVANFVSSYFSDYETVVIGQGKNELLVGFPESVSIAISQMSELAILGLTLRSLAAIARGLRETPFQEFVAQGMLLGRKMIVYSCEAIPSTCPKAYRSLLEGHRRTVEGFGINWSRNFCPISENTLQAGPPSIQAQEKLINASYILTLPPQTLLEIKPDTIITPLARDEAKIRRIQICEVTPHVLGPSDW